MRLHKRKIITFVFEERDCSKTLRYSFPVDTGVSKGIVKFLTDPNLKTNAILKDIETRWSDGYKFSAFR